MTVAVNNRRKEYLGNGVSTVFNGPMAYAAGHVQAFAVVGNVVTQIPGGQFQVERLGYEAGTRVTFTTPPAAGSMLLLLRTVPYSQEVDVSNQGAFHADTIEKGYDALAMQIQQLADGTMQLIFEDGEFVWDARGSRIVRVGPGINPTDAVNLGQVLELVTGGGSGPGSGVSPLLFLFEGDGVSTDFLMEGAQVDEPNFYDSAFEQVADSGDFGALRPGVDFSITPGNDALSRVLRLVEAPADGARGFTVLRGFARPASTEYVVSLDIPTFSIADPVIELDSDYKAGLVETTSIDPVSVTLRPNTGSVIDWRTGQYVSITQRGAGQVTVLGTGITLVAPAGMAAKTRGVGATITARCSFADTNTWFLSGDLMAAAESPDYVCIDIADTAALGVTSIAVGTTRAAFVMPFGLALKSVATGGVYASLAVAQAAGVLFTVDVNRNGVSLFSTRLTFDNAEKTTLTAATPATYVAGAPVLNAGDEITFDVDQIGTALAKGLRIYLVGQRVS